MEHVHEQGVRLEFLGFVVGRRYSVHLLMPFETASWYNLVIEAEK